MRIFIGASGWSYDHWKGIFYSEELPKSAWLAHYARHFNTVELNASFYRIPSQKSAVKWNKTVPEGFVFSIKASRLITHVKRLESCTREISWFFDAISPMKQKTGAILFQLPPSLKPDEEKLEAFCKTLQQINPTAADEPETQIWSYAFEFRNSAWYNSSTYKVLEKYGAAFCIHDMPGSATDRIITAPFTYIRFHGYQSKYGGNYPETELTSWAQWIQSVSPSCKRVFVYFNNDAGGFALKNASHLASLIRGKE